MDKIREMLKKYKEAYVSIGIHEDAGVYPGQNPPSVVEVALWNEFGTETSPSRSFIRSTMDEKESLINKWREEMIDNILFKEWTVEKALTAMGFRIQILVQNKIKSNVPPPLKESTAREKLAKDLRWFVLVQVYPMTFALLMGSHCMWGEKISRSSAIGSR